MEEAVVLEGLRMKGVGKFGRGAFSEGAEAKPLWQLGSMPTTILLGGEVVVEVAIHERRDLRPGARLNGPAIIVEDETSTIVTSFFDAPSFDRKRCAAPTLIRGAGV
jgi:N-methylhydantoinase A/oxoprolinase/acetone carboxylase beta subunit